MRTGTTRFAGVGVGAMGLMAGVLALGSAFGGEPSGAKAPGGGPGASAAAARTGKSAGGGYAQKIESSIKRIEASVARQPDMPTDLKNAMLKMAADLRDKKTHLDKLMADLKASDQKAVEADRAELRADGLQLMKDRLPIMDAGIQRVQDRLTRQVTAAPEVKVAVEKLIADLKVRKAHYEKLLADRTADDQEAVKDDAAALRVDRGQLMKDRLALLDARIKTAVFQLGAHANAPADVRADDEKSIERLKASKASLEKALSDFEARSQDIATVGPQKNGPGSSAQPPAAPAK